MADKPTSRKPEQPKPAIADLVVSPLLQVEACGVVASVQSAAIGALPPPAARLKPSWSVRSLG
jgi:hypothetical protein